MTESRVLLDGAPFDPAAADVTAWHHHQEVDSTMDEAHRLAQDGAPSGTVVLADVQRAGRGRAGKSWVSRAGDGVWFTLVEREVSLDALQVLSLRIGMGLAEALAPLANGRIWLKWPNDLLLGPIGAARPAWSQLGKVAGILVEARWREQLVEWVAIGVGVNLRAPESLPGTIGAAALRDGVTRAQVLSAIVPTLRLAAQGDGALSASELTAWHARDAARERRCIAPVVGVVHGVDATGALLIRSGATPVAHRSGSLDVEG
jgi:BirA family transcriptional regulator, biotin operon repressor / biotin---[acetyl-CoA-carboxylase] ligase